EEAYKVAIALGDGAAAYTNLAGVYLLQKRSAEAIKWARDATRLDPNYANAYVVLGQAYLLLPDRWEARKAFRTAAQLDEQWNGLILVSPPPPGAPWPREVNPDAAPRIPPADCNSNRPACE